MKRLLGLMIYLCSSIVMATPITLQHSKTSYVNAGICSAVVDVTIHDFLETNDKLYLDLVVKDKSGRVQGTSENVITSGDVQNFSGQSFGRVFVESETICGADSTWTVQVKRAVLVVDGKREDLLKAKKVNIDNFQPMKFKVQ
ncbi:IrmA family protein [Acinetobacter baumannii]|uniref:IrmA family protein n=1 Tax=Acinetobacter baumannii TaxID=470 RepID=UPI0020234608|nr:IrmA family protein [Acinetobacter baumannii]MCL8264255.1 IrmA family protein [Acinetobacter baumannii]